MLKKARKGTEILGKIKLNFSADKIYIYERFYPLTQGFCNLVIY